MTSARGFPPSRWAAPASTERPRESTARSPPAGLTSSSKSSRTSSGGVASTARSAGFEPTRRACAAAVAGSASASRTAARLQRLRQDELEEIRPGRREPAPAVESGGTLVLRLDDDLQTRRTGRDRVALRPVEQLATDPLFLVSRMHAELFDAEGGIGFLDRDVAGRLALQLGDEDGIRRSVSSVRRSS